MSAVIRGAVRAASVCRLARLESRTATLPTSLLQSRSYADNPGTLTDLPPAHSVSRISKWEKRLLVWAKIFPSIDQVPEEVSKTQMKKAKEWFRIRTANIMVVMFLVGCYFSMELGRNDLKSGDSMLKRGLEFEEENRRIGAEKRAKEATE